jgi:hypothetical protein
MVGPVQRSTIPCEVLATSASTAIMPAMAKSSCPLSQSQFLSKAEPLKIGINGQDMLAEVKAFSTGSFGWYLNGKTTIMVDGKAVSVQIGMNLTIVGSKEAPRE